MAVGGAEAPGAGPANVVVADKTPPANAASGNPSPVNSTGQGSAGSPGGPLPAVSTQPERRTDVVRTSGIAIALLHLNKAEKKLIASDQSGDEPTRRKAKAEAEREVQAAERELSDAIRQEAKRLSRPSSLAASARHDSAHHSPSRHDSARHASAQHASARHAGDLRQAEARIRDAFPSDAWGADEFVVGNAVRDIDRGRLPDELRRLSVAMRHGELSAEQQEEANLILTGAVDFVLNVPRDNIDLQLVRLQGLIQSVQELDRTFAATPVFAMVVIRCLDAMQPTRDDVPAVRSVVGDSNNVYVNSWIGNSDNFQ
jgi:hypothetical protein